MATAKSTDPVYDALLARLREASQAAQLAARTPARPELMKAAQARITKAQAAIDAHRAAWRALPQDAYQVAKREGMQPAEVLALRAELSPALWALAVRGGPVPARLLLAGQRKTRAETEAPSPVATAARIVHEAAADVARLERWVDEARTPTERRSYAPALRAARAKLSAAGSKRGAVSGSHALRFATDRRALVAKLAARDDEYTPPAAPPAPRLPADVADAIDPVLELGKALDAAAVAIGEDAFTSKLARAVRAAAEVYLETAPEDVAPAVEKHLATIEAALDGDGAEAALEAIRELADITGARLEKGAAMRATSRRVLSTRGAAPIWSAPRRAAR